MPTIGGMALSNATRVGSRQAVVGPDGQWTWAELNDVIAVTAGNMARAGIRKGDRVAVLAANGVEFIIACHAASRLGGLVVPVNTRLSPVEIQYILQDCGAAMLAVTGEYEEIARGVGRYVALGSLGPSDCYPNLCATSGVLSVDEDLAEESDDAFILYTSGTTGKPKGALFDHHRAIWAAMAQIVSLGLRDGDRYLHLAPMYHSGGTTFLNVTTLLGGTHVIVPAFNPATALDVVRQYRVDWLFGVPTMYQQILQHVDGAATHDTSWRIGVFGAAPMPATAVEALIDAFPGVRFFQQCGQTEAGPTGIYSTLEQIRRRPASSGHLAQPFVEARVVGDDGLDTPPGQVGELLFRGEAIMKGYWGQPNATSETIRAGWLHTGDLFHVHEDDALRLVDRRKDMVITGGRNVYSAEVEQAIATHRDVADVAVVGVPDPEWGETVVATVTLAPGSEMTVESLKEHCRRLIAGYKVPREIVLGDIPRNSTGKVQKQLLREEWRV